jgi:long-subunit acyl-CoA synthetase (AMP-forming)
MTSAKDSDLLLQSAYRFEKEHADDLYMTQPMGGGVVERYTWARTLDEARRTAAYLRSLELPEKSQIAIVSKNCAHFIMADLAIWMAGHVSVALYPTLNTETVEYILEHSESKFIFVGKLDNLDEIVDGIPKDMPRATFPLSPSDAEGKSWDEIISEFEPIEDSPTRPADELAILIYTSGSTGRPKGVMHNLGAMSQAARAIAKATDVTRNDRMLSYLPLAHAMERWLVESVSLCLGMQIFFAESLDTFVDDLQRARPTIFASVPRLWLKFQLGVFKKMPQKRLETLLKIPIINAIIRKKILGGLGLDACRLAGTGSAPIPKELIEWYRELGLDLLEAYGMSENFCYSHMSLPGKARAGYVGNTYPGVDCKINDNGEILVKSPGDMMGYFKEPEMSKEAFTEDGYLRTGDRGELDSAGRLKITGRVKELFKTSKGKYVAPAPIENLINIDSRVELSCVFGSGRPKACAVVNLAEDFQDAGSSASKRAEVEERLKALLSSVNEQVEGYEELQFLAVSKEAWSTENGLLTPTLKIRRPAIEDRYGPMLDDWYESGSKIIWE